MIYKKLKKIKLYILLYWNTFLSRFKKDEKYDDFIYEDPEDIDVEQFKNYKD